MARIVVFSQCGDLAGDLAAILSGRFLVNRATSLTGARQALALQPAAVIIVEGRSLARTPELHELVELGLEGSCRVLLLGAEPESCPSSWAARVTFLNALPEPGEIIQALQGLPRQALGTGS